MKFLRLAATLTGLWMLIVHAAAQAQEGQLTVTPAAGPVGTTVVLEGNGCNNPGQPKYLVFQNGDDMTGATVGAERVALDPADNRDQFKAEYTIPVAFAEGSLQGRGGGSLTPGVYYFVSRPPICQASFTLTPSPNLPETGGLGRAAPTSHPLLWSLGISATLGAAVFISALMIASRKRSARS
jgi:hypothetical protein